MCLGANFYATFSYLLILHTLFYDVDINMKIKLKLNSSTLLKFGLLVLFIAFSTYSIAQKSSSLVINNILQSNMVIQQDKPFKVWGKGIVGQEVWVKGDWNSSPSKKLADYKGEFSLEVDVPKAKKGDYKAHSLLIWTKSDTIELQQLLIGDVWFLSGQSNMQFSLMEDKFAEATLKTANHPHIRFFTAELNFSTTPLLEVKGKWKMVDPPSVKYFSAVGYYFGQYLNQSLDIPVGLIFSGIGASKVEAFLPQDVLKKDRLLDSMYLRPYLKDPKSKEVVDGGFSFEKVTRPFLLYNAMINPFKNLSIKGFCWYQGEGNRTERKTYTLATQKLIESWRKEFGQGNLPFYYVQVAPYSWDIEDPSLNDYAFFREAQEHVTKITNTAMVISMDVGEAKDIHPKNKGPLGVRLAKTALNLTYHMDTVQYLGPELKRVAYFSNQAVVYYNPASVKSGLKTSDGKPPMFFQVAGVNKKFYDAVAEIVGNTIRLHSDHVLKPVEVRYAFTNYPVTNLINKAGLPAIPFRTDNWKE
jgi:sialate O-acetylesterase